MDRLDGASQAEADPDLLKGEVGLFGEQAAQLAPVGAEDDRLAAAAVMARFDAAGVTALLDEFFDQPSETSNRCAT